MSVYELAALTYVFIYFVIIIGVRSFILYKNTGVNVLGKFGRKGRIGRNERGLTFASLIIPIVAFNYVFIPQNYHLLLPFAFLELDWIKNTGIIVYAIGFLIAIIAQFQMQNDWRIGVDPEQNTNLVTRGLYQYSRNPIYVGIIISFIGFFLLLPSWASFTFLGAMISFTL